VHPIQSTTDFFSAQDQLLEPNEAGTAHIGTSELASGILYASTLIDLSRLRENLGLDPSSSDADKLRQAVAAIIEAVVSTDPSAKRGNTGATGETVEVVVEIGETIGLSAMPAFERPCAAVSDIAASTLRSYVKTRQARLTSRQRPNATITLSSVIEHGGTMDDFIAQASDAAVPAQPASAPAQIAAE
jgi:hypothetical protein